MAKGIKTGGRNFKKGVSANPKGRTRLPSEIVEARKLNRDSLEVALNKYLHMKRDALQAAIKNPDTPMLDVMIASIIAKAVQTGDNTRLDFLLNRTIGRIKEVVHVEGGNNNTIQIALAYKPKELASEQASEAAIIDAEVSLPYAGTR
jgi:DNA-binding sugar fermentation-stimulating protein